MRRGLLGLLLVPLVTSCAVLPEMIGNSMGVPVAGKTVRAKVEPSELVAADGSSCTISRKAWERVEVGERYVCGWSLD